MSNPEVCICVKEKAPLMYLDAYYDDPEVLINDSNMNNILFNLFKQVQTCEPHMSFTDCYLCDWFLFYYGFILYLKEYYSELITEIVKWSIGNAKSKVGYLYLTSLGLMVDSGIIDVDENIYNEMYDTVSNSEYLDDENVNTQIEHYVTILSLISEGLDCSDV